MKYQIFLAEDWVDVKQGVVIDSPWDTTALQYRLYDGSSGHTVHWTTVDNAHSLDTGEELRSEPAFREPTKNIA